MSESHSYMDRAREAVTEVEQAILAAYEAGYKEGMVAGRASFVGAVQTLAAELNSGKAAEVVAIPKASPSLSLREDPSRTHGYGAISSTLMTIMREAPKQGLLIADVYGRANNTGTKMTVRQVREGLKRLKASDLVVCRNRRKWVATPKLRETANEKGAPEGAPQVAGRG